MYTAPYITEPIINPEPTESPLDSSTLSKQQANILRLKLLAQSDWTQLLDAPLTPEVQGEWAVYRQALRDLPDQVGYPDTITWPTPPSS